MHLLSAKELSQTKPIADLGENFPTDLFQTNDYVGLGAILLIGLVAGIILYRWVFITAKNRPSYKNLLKNDKTNEIPMIGALPFIFLIFLMILFLRELLSAIIILVFSKSVFKLNLENPGIADSTVFAYTSIFSSLTVVLLFFVMIRKNWQFPIVKALFQGRLRKLRDIFASVGVLFWATIFIYTIVGVVWFIVLKQFNVPFEEQSQITQLKSSGDLSFWLPMTLAIVVVAPIFEEILFRGFLYNGLRKYLPAGLAAITQGIIFGAIHYSLPSFLPLTILGIVLALMYERYNSLLPSIIAHSLFNSLTIITIFSTHYEFTF